MAFYGESYELDVAKNVTGSAVTDFGDSIRLHFDAESMTVNAGDAFMVGAFVDPTELPVPDDAVVSWVIETGPGSAGTLRISSGLDPGFTVNDPADATEALGDFAASGTQTIVAGPTSLPMAILLDQSQEPVVLIECIAGSVQILQVKLRVWPAGGPAGAWTAGAPFETPGPWYTYSGLASINTEAVHYGTAAEAHNAAVDALEGQLGSDVEASRVLRTGVVPSATVGFVTWDLVLGGYWFVHGGVGMAYLVFSNPGPQSMLGPDASGLAGIDPREVPSEGQVRGPGGGALGTPTFSHWAGTFSATGGMYPGANAVATPPAVPSGSNWLVPFALPGSMGAGTVDLDSMTSEAVLVGAMPPEYFTTPSTGYITGGDLVLTDTAAWMLIPAYEWFNPGLPWVDEQERPDPRFFVKDWDGRWAPVGFGKPPEETSTFKTWTPLGMLRDLTTAEYDALGADERPARSYPLKVKREDGSWDQVAWMVPE